MALVKCRECGTEVSESAKTCPKCGISKPVKKISFAMKLFLGLFALSIIISAMNTAMNLGSGSSTSGGEKAPHPSASPAQAEKQAEEDAHHRAYRLMDKTKASLKDPDSAKFSNLTIDKLGIALCGWVNAKNSFGGYTGATRFAYVDNVGFVDDPAVAEALCTGPNAKLPQVYKIRNIWN